MQRKVRSFVRRDSRLTPAQARAIAQHKDTYLFDPECYRGARTDRMQIVEIGAGDGDCALSIAGAHPAFDYLAVEVYRPGLGRLLAKAHAAGLRNLEVYDRDVTELLPGVPPELFDLVFVFFPDPWPKKRHHKRRLITPAFLDQLAPAVATSGRLYIATDIEDYAHQIAAAVETSPFWYNLAGSERFAPRPKIRPLTKFEKKGLAVGRAIFDVVAARVPSGLNRNAK